MTSICKRRIFRKVTGGSGEKKNKQKKRFCKGGCQSSSLNILAPLCFVIIFLVFFYLCKVLFSGFFQFNSNFVDAQNNSKYSD